MLTDLLIKNYALIEQLKLKPHTSLNIITGETGAGKSIMLGAIGLLLGNRADLKVLFDTAQNCVVEASFLVWPYQMESLFKELDLDYEDQTNIRRVISPSGKSRAFINDIPVTLEVLRKIGSRLLDVHSQHDNLMLGDHLYQLQVLDNYAQNQEVRVKYQTLFQEYSQLKKQYEAQLAEYDRYKQELEYNQFLLEELQKAAFRSAEQEELESELKILENAEEVKTKLNQITEFLSRSENAVNDEMRVQVNALAQIADLSPEYEQARERLESALIELQDIASDLERLEEEVEFNPGRTEEIQDRLSLLYNLLQKHHKANIDELIALQEDLEQKVNRVLNFDDDIQQLKVKVDEAQSQVMHQAAALTESRKQVSLRIQQELKELLSDLGMPNSSFEIHMEQTEPGPNGCDQVNFLFSANKGIAPQEISKVASGGEFSRLMLAIKYILADKTALPTIIFDEIDTGISGEIAVKMGAMFRTMSQKHQIIAISHLHQIAAKGNHHYFVYKDDSGDRTISRIRQLSQEERIHEIAQMISGSQPSESALLSAREMLDLEA